MSYVLQLWSFPIPENLQDADRILGDLARRSGPSDPRYQALAKALTARHPCITTLDDDDPRAVWTDGPFDGLAGGPSWSIGILSQHVDHVQPFVVETATAMGFVVFDDQQGCCYLPGGWTLTHEGRTVGRHLGRPLEGPLTGALAERALMQALESLLAGRGFRHDPMVGGLWRKTGTITQVLSWKLHSEAQSRVVCDVEVWFVSDQLRKPWNAHEETYALASGRPKGRYKASARTTFSRLAYFADVHERILLEQDFDTSFRIDSLDDLRRVAWLLRLIADDWLLKVLDKSLDLDHLSFWMHDPKPGTWRKMTATVGGVQRSVERHLFDTVGCGGPAASVLLAWASNCPDLAIVRREERHNADAAPPAERAEAQLRLDLVERALRDAGI